MLFARTPSRETSTQDPKHLREAELGLVDHVFADFKAGAFFSLGIATVGIDVSVLLVSQADLEGGKDADDPSDQRGLYPGGR